MPSIWVGLASSRTHEFLLPSELHDMVSHIAHAENPPRFSAHSEQIARGTVLVTVRLLDDALDECAQALPGNRKLNDGTRHWRLHHLTKVRQVPWAELAPRLDRTPGRWRVSLATTTSWSGKPGEPPDLAAERLLHSAADRWRAVNPDTCPVPRGTRFPHVRIMNKQIVESQQTERDESLKGVQGYLDLESRDPRSTPLVKSLLDFLVLAGTGRHVTRGMGVVRLGLVPAETAPSAHHIKRRSA